MFSDDRFSWESCRRIGCQEHTIEEGLSPQVGRGKGDGAAPRRCRGCGTERRALRGPGAPAGGRGRTETPPAKLSACATCCQAAYHGGEPPRAMRRGGGSREARRRSAARGGQASRRTATGPHGNGCGRGAREGRAGRARGGGGSNGGRARCPHRAARVMCGCNARCAQRDAGDGAERTRRCARGGKATHRADGAAARWGHRALPQRDRMAMGVRGGRGEGAGCQAAHRGGESPRAMWRGGASREGGEPPRAVAAKHRALPQRDCMAMVAGVVHASGVWQRGTREGRASGVRGGGGGVLFCFQVTGI